MENEDGDDGALLDLLEQAILTRQRADDHLSAIQAEVVPLKLFSLGISTTAPNAEIGAAMAGAASALEKLDNVALECRALGGSLSSLSSQAEVAVRRVRDIDAQRARLQAALERVDDILDLRGCLQGVQSAMDCGDWDQAAMHVNRFRSLERTLPIPESDVAVMREAEDALVATVTAQFDAAIAAASAGLGRSSGAGAPQSAPNHAVIARCCQLMTLLGHADAGLQRYAAFLHDNLSVECTNEMRAAVAAGLSIDEPAVGLNLLSAVLSRAVAALEHAAPLVASLFAVDERGPASVLAGVHAVCDHEAARVILSVLRSGRVYAALLARDAFVTLNGDRAAMRRSAQRQLDLSTGSALASQHLSPSDAARVLAQIDDVACPAPLALLPLPPMTSHIYGGRDFSDAAVFDALIDELALVLQRCASYQRLILGRAAAITAQQLHRSQQLAVNPAADASAPAEGKSLIPGTDGLAPSDAPTVSAEAAVRSHAELLEASLELGGVYSALEHAKLHGGVAKAICIDELVEEGAAGAGLDILSPLSLDLPPRRPEGANGASVRGRGGSVGGGGLETEVDELADAAQVRFVSILRALGMYAKSRCMVPADLAPFHCLVSLEYFFRAIAPLAPALWSRPLWKMHSMFVRLLDDAHLRREMLIVLLVSSITLSLRCLTVCYLSWKRGCASLLTTRHPAAWLLEALEVAALAAAAQAQAGCLRCRSSASRRCERLSCPLPR
jgi:hypothetical protein